MNLPLWPGRNCLGPLRAGAGRRRGGRPRRDRPTCGCQLPAPCSGAPRHPLLGPDRFPAAGFECLRLPPSRSNFHPWCKQTEIRRNCVFPGLSNIVLTVLLEETNEKFQSKHLGIGVGKRTRTFWIFSLSAKTIHAPFNFKKYL